MPLTCQSGATAVALAKDLNEAETIPEMRVIHLNLSDLEELIRQYEAKYQTTTVAMLSNAEVRSRIMEDDLLEWEAYVNQRSSLREYYETVHREYLHHRSTNRQKRAAEDPTAYAA